MAKINNFEDLQETCQNQHINALKFMKIFNSKRKIPIFHFATSKTEIGLKAGKKVVVNTKLISAKSFSMRLVIYDS